MINLDVRNQARIEDRLTIRLGIEPTIQVEIRPLQLEPRELGHPLERFETLREQHRIRFIDGCHRQGGQHIPVVLDDRDDFLALLVFVP